jgi:hypothetical protein
VGSERSEVTGSIIPAREHHERADKHSVDSGATLDVVNGTAATRYLSLQAIAQLEGSAGGTLDVRAAGEPLRFEISDQVTPIVIELGVPPRTTRVALHVQAGGPPDARRDEPPTLSLDDVWYDASFTRRS